LLLLVRALAAPAAGSTPAAGRLPRAVALLAALAGLLVVPSASAAPAPALTTRTTISGSRTGWTRVTLPRAMAVDGTPTISVSNPAAFAGVVLVREKSYNPESAYVVRHETGTGTVYRYGWAGQTEFGGTKDFPVYARRVLPAGTYRLYLMASGPVTATVTWPLPGGRSSTLRPGNSTVSYDAQEKAPGVPGVAVASAYGLSARHPMARRSLLVGFTWFTGSVSAVEMFGGCKMEAPDPAPMAPTCPGGGVNLVGLNVATPTGGMAIGYAYVGAGNWLNKSYYALAGHLTDAGNAIYFLDLGAGFPS
jgi:hypothetical protein